MEEARPLPAHGVFVAAREIEDPVCHRREVRRQRHEAMVAVDRNERSGIAHGGGKLLQRAAGGAGIEEHLAHIDEVVPAPRASRTEALREGRHGIDRHALHRHEAVFFQPRDLAREGMELPIRGEDAARPVHRQGREEPAQEFVRVRRHREGGGIGQVEDAGNAALHRRDHVGEDRPPLLVGVAGRLLPAQLLRRKRHVRPVMMAVGREMQPLGLRLQEAAEMLFQIEHKTTPPRRLRG
jgi:hypothetical protein